MQDSIDLLKRNLYGVFGERDAEARKKLIPELWTLDCMFIDPEGSYQGHEELNAMIAKLHAVTPGFIFKDLPPQQAHHDVARLGWKYGPKDGEPVVIGVDVAVFREGKIAAMYTFFD